MDQSLALARRLKELVQKHGGNKRVAADSGIPLSTLNTYLAGTEPKLLVAARLAEHFRIPLEALFDEVPRSQEFISTGSTIHIPVRDVYASAGPGSEVFDEAPTSFLAFSSEFVDAWDRSLAHVEAIHARGDSMEPTIQDGAVVLIDRAERSLVEGRIFVFRTPDGLRLKRFQRTIDGAALLISDNRERYAPERVSSSDFEQLRVAGRAFWTGRMI
jgi:phage repressor protein C with HTH and peptisase S24 domain